MRRTIHTARYLPDAVYRRKITWQLNKGESLHALSRDLGLLQPRSARHDRPDPADFTLGDGSLR
jgi:Tn3 transposase DDE domain